MKFAHLLILIALTSACAQKGSGSKSPVPSFSGNQTQDSGSNSNPGGWESSGGGGVACFTNSDDATVARSEIEKNGFLSAESRKKIQTLQTLDSWDFLSFTPQSTESVTSISKYLKAVSFQSEASLQAVADYQGIIDKTLQNVDGTIPLFSQRFRLLQKHFPVNEWADSSKIPIVRDSTPQRAITQNCVMIQLADRFTKSLEGRLPETKIVLDIELFNLLSALEKALLVSHEYLYLMGREGGHSTSDAIRKINAFMFSKDIFAISGGNLKESDKALSMRLIVGYPFGDYMRFFRDEPELNGISVRGSGGSRYRSLISLMIKMRNSMEQCLNDKGYAQAAENKIQGKCQRQVVENNPTLWSSLTPEEAFMFMGRFYFDQVGWDFNSELLAVWDSTAPVAQSAEQLKLATQECNAMVDHPSTEFLIVQENAKTYCRDTLRITVKLLNETPLKRRFNCHSEKHTVMFFDSDENPTIAVDVNQETGAINSPPFLGKHELLSSRKGTVTRNLGRGNIEYQAVDTYRLTPANSSDENLIWSLLKIESGAFAGMNVETKDESGKVVTLSSVQEAFELLKSKADRIKIVNFDLKLSDCVITESNLPQNAWWYH